MQEYSDPLPFSRGTKSISLGRAHGHYAFACLFCLLALFQSISAQGLQQLPGSGNRETRASAITLEIGKTVAGEIGPDLSTSYRFTTTAGQFVHIVVAQRNVRLTLVLEAPDGAKLREVSSPDDLDWPEHIWLAVETSGAYVLEVRGAEKTAAGGRYEVKLVELRPSTKQDNDRAAAGLLFHDALQLRNEHSAEGR